MHWSWELLDDDEQATAVLVRTSTDHPRSVWAERAREQLTHANADDHEHTH